jgi:hypothetical protein
VGYNRRGYFPLWDTTEKNLRMANNFFLLYPPTLEIFSFVVSYTTTESYAVYCIPEKSSALYPTAPQVFFRCIPYGRYFPPLWDTMEEVFFIVGYNKRGFFPFWDTTEEVFSVVGYNGKKLYNSK